MKEYALLKVLIRKIKEDFDYSKPYSVGSIICDKKGNILSFGTNSYCKTHPMQKQFNMKISEHKLFLHSEIDALVKLRSDNAHTMILARVTKTGMIKISKPCNGCFEAIKENGIKKVYYTNDFGDLVLLDFDSYST